MPNLTRNSPKRRPPEPWLIPLAHPSWSGEAVLPDLAQPLHAAEFWKRLGL
jgi:hypothetical protein